MRFFDMKYISKVSRSERLYMCHVSGKADFVLSYSLGTKLVLSNPFFFSKSASLKVAEEEAREDVRGHVRVDSMLSIRGGFMLVCEVEAMIFKTH